MKRETFGRCLLLLACLLLLTVGGQTGQRVPQAKQPAFVFVVQNGTPVWIRWSAVSQVKLFDDNGGEESFWELTVQGAAENPVIVKNAYAFPLIAERVKD